MASADLVQTKGLGLALCQKRAMKGTPYLRPAMKAIHRSTSGQLWSPKLNEWLHLPGLANAKLMEASHQARIAHHIRREDRGETAGGGRGSHCSSGVNSRAEF
jgi:hypothetical protein